ncbi:pyruvate dehydrogenase (quinone) [Kineosphaera limosa]|uniref:Pyruvate dehydrogenase n=1 Tax=Kineosphaera limosa NBRC 100340 TaxID=1184609 RepID=K6VI54_9MICO|nr:pyruvate dehydrogenase [Kineosphaera limosa]NYE01305.1 pyruvate dehydrogenase (quinone) [Kineosphaera limosa]GAB95898.1 pyruvate dehydrogenase [Kineosphaera limosa NBRC 100340]
MAAKTVADQLVEFLTGLGVERIYGLVGDSLNPVSDSLRRQSAIEWVDVHNEEAAAFAAAAEARLTGKLAVCAGSCGPGNTHLIQGLYDANRSGSKVLAIASHIPSGQIGTSFFQETHPEALFAEASVYAELANSPRQAARILHIATQTAIARSGVGVLVLPGDIAAAPAVDAPALGAVSTTPPAHVPAPAAVADLAQRLNAAQKVTLFVGAGVAGAHGQVMALAEKLKAPVGHALGGKEWIQYDNPYEVGMSGLLGYGAAYDACHEADLLLLLGTDFPYDQFLPEKVQIVQVDRNGERLGRRAKLDQAVEGDVAATVEALLPLLAEKRDRSFLDKMLSEHCKKLEKVVDAYTKNVEKHTPIHPEYVASVLDQLADDDAIFTVDTGMCNVWAARYITPNGRRRIIGSWHHGTMANALPHAIGASCAYPDRQVISMSGDGGLAMLLGELLTVVEHQLNTKVIVFNNSTLGMVRLEMLVDAMPAWGTDRPATDYAAIAAAAGMPSVRITDPATLADQLREALAADGPRLIDIVTDPNALSIPPHITGAQLQGFAMAATRIVLDGGVGDMLKLARSNLRNIPR